MKASLASDPRPSPLPASQEGVCFVASSGYSLRATTAADYDAVYCGSSRSLVLIYCPYNQGSIEYQKSRRSCALINAPI